MGLCNFISYICCPRRFHRNNVLDDEKNDAEIKLKIDEFEEVFRETSRLVEVSLEK